MSANNLPPENKIHKIQKGKKHTLEQLRAFAKETHGGRCLGTKYVNSKAPQPWQCSKGHIWIATADSVLNMQSWCPDCGGQPHVTIDHAKALARKHKGKCLSEIYENSYTPLSWQCKKGHHFQATYSKVKGTPKKKGTWCPVCANNQRKTLKDEKAYAMSRGWKCLAAKYINNRTALPYQCSNGHTWKERPGALRNRGICPACKRQQKYNAKTTKSQKQGTK